MELPGDLSVTAVDVAAHESIASLAEGHGELTGLALWLLAERQKVLSTPKLTSSLHLCTQQGGLALVHQKLLSLGASILSAT